MWLEEQFHHHIPITCLKLAVQNKWFMSQLDISSAYLYIDLDKELYIRTLPHKKLSNKVVKLKKKIFLWPKVK